MSDKATSTTRHPALAGESGVAAESRHLQLRKPEDIADPARLLLRSDKQSPNAPPQDTKSTTFDLSRLTVRQKQVLHLVVDHKKLEREIARILGISKTAVRTHKRRIAHRLGLKSLPKPKKPLSNIVLKSAEATNPDLNRLTHREKEVFVLVRQKKPVKEIARILGISKFTVRYHKRNIVRRLGSQSSDELEKPLTDITLQNPKAQAALCILSPREKGVFALVLQYKLEKEIAYIMGISKEAVKQHKRNILRKLKVGSIVRLISVFGDIEQITVERLKEDPSIGNELGIGLPRRTEQLIRLVEEGLKYRDIAAKIGVALGTVHATLSLLFKRLNVHSKAELVGWNNRRKQYLALRDASDQPAASSGVVHKAE